MSAPGRVHVTEEGSHLPQEGRINAKAIVKAQALNRGPDQYPDPGTALIYIGTLP